MRETFALLVLLYLKGQIGCENWEDVAVFRSRLSRNMVIYHNSHMQKAYTLLEKGDTSSDRSPRMKTWTINDLTDCPGYKFGLQIPQTDNVLQQFVRPELEQTLQARNDSDFGKRDDVSDNIAMDDNCPYYRLALPQEQTDQILEKFERHIAKEEDAMDDNCPYYRLALPQEQTDQILEKFERHIAKEEDAMDDNCPYYRLTLPQEQTDQILEKFERHIAKEEDAMDDNCPYYRLALPQEQTDQILEKFERHIAKEEDAMDDNCPYYRLALPQEQTDQILEKFERHIAKEEDAMDDNCPYYRLTLPQEQTDQILEKLERHIAKEEDAMDDNCPYYRLALPQEQTDQILEKFERHIAKEEDAMDDNCPYYRLALPQEQTDQILEKFERHTAKDDDAMDDNCPYYRLTLPQEQTDQILEKFERHIAKEEDAMDDNCPYYRLALPQEQTDQILEKFERHIAKEDDTLDDSDVSIFDDKCPSYRFRLHSPQAVNLLKQMTKRHTVRGDKTSDEGSGKREDDTLSIIGDEKVCGGYRFRSGEQQMDSILDSIRSNTSPKNDIRSSDRSTSEKLGNKKLKPSSLANYYLSWSSILQRTSVSMKQQLSNIELALSSMDYFWPFNYEMVKMNQRVAFYGLTNHLDRQNLKARYYKIFYGMYNLPIPVSENRVVLNFNDPNIATILNKTLLMDASEDSLENTTYAYTDTEKNVVSQKIAEAMDIINRTSPDLYRSINQLISCIAVYKSKPGSDTIAGSMGTLPGVIYINAKTSDGDWPAAFYAELIVHEYIHNALFLEELILGTYTDRRILSQAKVVSAMLRIPRKYDHSLHAAYVVAGLVSFHGRAGYTERADSLLEPLRTSVNELVLANQKHGALTETGETMLQNLADFVEFIGK